jgi:hypothetical protein
MKSQISSKQATPQAANGQQEPASVGSSPPPSTSIYQGLRAIEPKREPKREPLFTTLPMTDDEFAEMVEAANSPSAKLIEELERENARLREHMTEAWKLVNAMAGQEYWQRAEDWLAENRQFAPEGIILSNVASDLSSTGGGGGKPQPERPTVED